MSRPPGPKYKPKQHDNHGVHIRDIVSRTICAKHDADRDIPCYWITNNVIGVCGDRVKKAGFTRLPSKTDNNSK